MHTDDYDNTLIHLVGRKSVVLIDPEPWLSSHAQLLQSHFTKEGTHADLYALEGENGSANDDGCWGVRGIARLHCSLEPGDLLYIPFGWLHDVESQSPTASAALRFELGTKVSPDLIYAAAFDQ